MIIDTEFSDLFQDTLTELLIHDMDLELDGYTEKDTGAVIIDYLVEPKLYIAPEWQEEYLANETKEILELDDTEAIKAYLKDVIRFIEIMENNEELYAIVENNGFQIECYFKLEVV